MVFPMLYSMTVDPETWGENPLEFNPERHLDGKAGKDKFLTFGTGEKSECPTQYLTCWEPQNNLRRR